MEQFLQPGDSTPRYDYNPKGELWVLKRVSFPSPWDSVMKWDIQYFLYDGEYANLGCKHINMLLYLLHGDAFKFSLPQYLFASICKMCKDYRRVVHIA